MCGIVGILGKHEVSPIILDALQRLEYRGYDSAGTTEPARPPWQACRPFLAFSSGNQRCRQSMIGAGNEPR